MKERASYFQYTTRSRLDKAINTLLGIVEGIAMDGVVKPREREYLDAWVADHRDAMELHPFDELIPVVAAAIADGRLDPEEREDIRWLCEKLRSIPYYDRASADMQRLHAILGGVAADGVVSRDELVALRQWIDEHETLRTLWPYDEVSSLITGVLADGKIDEAEHDLLRAFFGEFRERSASTSADGSIVPMASGLNGICAACPEIDFAGMKFCFTGASARYTREQLTETVTRLGGSVTGSVSAKTHFLVVGAEGNPCWAYACYGRKIEKAMELRREGARIVIVHESDFNDAVADRG
jgi:NAD-dependent DNA ligase